MRYLGIDYGTKRIGIALSDDEGRIALPGKMIQNISKSGVLKELRAILKKEHVEKIIIGLPVALRGGDTETTRKVRLFAQTLEKELAQPIEFENENFTSRIASVHTKKTKIDEASAALILQSYLDK